MRSRFLVVVPILLVILPSSANAGIDAPGAASFGRLAHDEIVFERLELPEEDMQASSIQADAWFHSRASRFDPGVLIWMGFELPESQGILILDLDLAAGLRLGPDTIEAEYIEKAGDRILFGGSASRALVTIQDAVFSSGDGGALEIRFDMVVADPTGEHPGSRLLLDGHALTQPGPATVRYRNGLSADAEPVVVETGCGVGVETEDESDDEPVESCDGDDWDDGEDDWDDDDESDWEGDTWDDDDDSIWEGDTWDEDEQGLTDASTIAGRPGRVPEAGCATARPPRRRSNFFRYLMRFFPELTGLAFIQWMKKRNRRKRSRSL